MAIDSNSHLNKVLPKWAGEKIQQVLKIGKSASADTRAPDGFVMSERSQDNAVRDHRNNKQTILRYKYEDNNPQRDTNLESGVIERRDNERTFFSGSIWNGSSATTYRTRFGESAQYTELRGHISHSVLVGDNGAASYHYQDTRDPARSFVLHNNDVVRIRKDYTKPTEHFSATDFAADLFQVEQSKNTSLRQQTANLFLGQSDRLPSVRADLIKQVKNGVDKLPKEAQEDINKILASANSYTPRRLYRALTKLAKNDPDSDAIKALRELTGSWQILEDAPKLMADGLVRTQEFYLSPGALALSTAAQGWDIEPKLGLPIADSIIVGGGPGGLATGYHLAEQGKRTIIFEGGKVGQGFSDASAQSVHQLRTTERSSDLIYTNSWNRIGASLLRNGPLIREKGDGARERWTRAKGEKNHGGADGGAAPLDRNNIFEHLVQIGHGLATKYPDTFLVENSPVSKFEKVQHSDETLFRVKTENGHDVLTRSLVMATGFVGSSGENARSLKQFLNLESEHPDSVTVLGNDHDIVKKNAALANQNKALVFSERLLGRPEIRSWIKSRAKGFRLAVVGSGESAVKGAIEALNLNPEIKLSLYTKHPLEPYQVQIPTSHFSDQVTEHALKNRELANKTMTQLRELNTPITAETMKTLLKFESEGRLRIKELGARFNESIVDIRLGDQGDRKFQFQLRDAQVAERLRQQREDWVASGLYGDRVPTNPADELEGADGVMMAIGYDTTRVNASPLMQQLIDLYVVDIQERQVQYSENGLTSSKHPLVAFNTAGAVRMSADTALPGRAVRGFRLAQHWKDKLPSREAPSSSIAKFEETEPERPIMELDEVESFVTLSPRGLNDSSNQFFQDWVAGTEDPEEQEWLRQHLEHNQTFSEANAPVRALVGRYLEHPDSLTPPERLAAQRALQLIERLKTTDL